MCAPPSACVVAVVAMSGESHACSDAIASESACCCCVLLLCGCMEWSETAWIRATSGVCEGVREQ